MKEKTLNDFLWWLEVFNYLLGYSELFEGYTMTKI